MNFLEIVNQRIFLAFNAAPGTSASILSLADFLANGVIFVVPVILLCQWFLGGRGGGHRQALFCTLSIVAALTIGALCGSLWFHPRPFMIPLGHTWIDHPADNSFPSDHGSVMFSAAFALLSLRLRALGLAVLLMALSVAWARIFLGVHFPLDMVGSVLVSAAGVCVARAVWQVCGLRLVQICEAVDRKVFCWLPARFRS
ncbi:undecaprenyl-diphosphatase [Raoultella terrigena]|uniref:undecaprenyl-diphosphatase n=1 Tax=Raoultella terrigena TaxID=577 RepID=UPI001F44F70A|nr:undecaprenyl-diphosphatase [Raoultella terrigena]MCE9900779.1 undecaprenyl-diphosphatase [Raoultella terrigena]